MALNLIAVCQVITTIAAIVSVAVFIWAVFAFKSLITRKIDLFFAKVQPVVDEAKSIAEQARDTTEKVSEKVDSIMSRAESTANTVSEKVESVSGKLEEAINPQIAVAVGVLEAGVKLVHIYREIVQSRQSKGTQFRTGSGNMRRVAGL